MPICSKVGGNGFRADNGLYHPSNLVWVHKKNGTSSLAPCSGVPASRGSEAEAYARSDKGEEEEACVSEQEETISRSAEMLCIIAS